jgi:hypothetical protein
MMQHRELYDNVLTALSQLAIADNQSLSTLVESLTLIPSLVSFIYNVTSAIWSELEMSENSARNHNSWLVHILSFHHRALLVYLRFTVLSRRFGSLFNSFIISPLTRILSPTFAND